MPGIGSDPNCHADGSGNLSCGSVAATQANFTRFSQLTISPTTLINYGDSITACAGASNTGACYHYLMAQSLGATTHTVYGYGGDQACDTSNRFMLPNDVPAVLVPQVLRTFLISVNDANNKGAGSYESTFNACHLGLSSYIAVPLQTKTMGSTATKTGSCATDTTYAANQGFTCSSSGSTATLSLTTTGGPIYIWPRIIDSDAGTWTYSVDGGIAVSQTTAITPSISTQNGTTQSMGFIRVSGLAAGSHTILFTQTSSTGHMAVVAIGTPDTALPIAGQPAVILGDTPNWPSIPTATLNAYRSDIAANIALLQGDGLNVFAAPVSTTYQGTATANDYVGGGNYHPNDAGNRELFQAFIQPIKAAMTPAGNFAVAKNITSGYSVLPTDQTLLVSGGGTVTFSSGSNGQIVRIYNYDPANPTTLSITGPYNTYSTMQPLSGATLYYISSGGGWIVVGNWSSITSGSSRLVPSGNITANATDAYLFVAGGGTVTLNTSNPPGQIVSIYNYDPTLTETLTVSGTYNTVTSLAPYSGVTFYYISSVGGWVSFGSTQSQVKAIINAGGATYAAANTLTGLPSGCTQVPCKVASLDLTDQTANASATLYTPTIAGTYRFSCYTVITTAATTSSTLPYCAVLWKDKDTSGFPPGWVYATTSQSTNTVGTVGIQNGSYSGVLTISSAASQPISYNLAGYATSGATAMQYAAHIKLEYLGQ